jgi:hypothetical protein
MDQTEANGCHRGDRTLDRTRSLFDRTRPVSVQRLHVFQLFDQTLDRTWSLFDRTRSVSVQRLRVFQLFDRMRNASGHSRPDVSGLSRSLVDSNRTRALWRPVRHAVRPVTVLLERCSGLTSASGPLRVQRVWSARLQLFQVPNGYIRRGTSINTRWPAQSSISLALFDILVSTLS